MRVSLSRFGTYDSSPSCWVYLCQSAKFYDYVINYANLCKFMLVSILEANSVPLLCKPAKFYANFMPVSSQLPRPRLGHQAAATTPPRAATTCCAMLIVQYYSLLLILLGLYNADCTTQLKCIFRLADKCISKNSV